MTKQACSLPILTADRRSVSRARMMKTPLSPDERPIHDAGANHQRGLETVGGHLYLTDQRLVFEPHAFNLQSAVQHWPLADVSAVAPCWTKFLGLIPLAPNSIAVTIAGVEQRFVVWGRQRWLDVLGAVVLKRQAP
jgi:hypothetical protein